MNRVLFLLIIVFVSSCSKSQTWEQGICDCIKSNYNVNDFDFFAELKMFEEEMINRQKFTLELKSKIELLEKQKKIQRIDFFKNEFSERLLTFGEESIRYCVKREYYNRGCSETHWSKDLIIKLDYYKAKLQVNKNIDDYNQKRTNAIVEALNNSSGEAQLKEIILLHELYYRIPDEAQYKLIHLGSFEDIEK